MFNLSGSELIFMVVIALVVLGPDKLPEAMRKAGKAYADFKRMTSGFQSEMKSVLDEPMRELRETAELAKNAASWDTKMFNPTSPSADAKSSGGPTDRTATAPPTSATSAATSAANGSEPPTAATPVVAAKPASPAFTSAAPTTRAEPADASSSTDAPLAVDPAPTPSAGTEPNSPSDATSRRLARQPAAEATVASGMMTGLGSVAPAVPVDTDEVAPE